MKPIDFQDKAVKNAELALSTRRKVLVVSPGGSGKTVMIAHMAARAVDRGAKRVLVISHRKEILEQTRNTFENMGMNPDDVAILGDHLVTSKIKVLACSIQRLYRGTWRAGKPDLVILDEAHHVSASGYTKVLSTWTCPQAGFTATPFRLDGRGLGDFYDEMIIAAKPSELITIDWIAKPEIYKAPEPFMPDIQDLRVARGDYVQKDLMQAVGKRKIIGNVVDNYLLRTPGRKALVFGVGVEHSMMLRDQFKAAGISAAHLDGETKKEDREDVLAKFAAGEVTVLCNCFILSEGYDLPSCEVVVLARPTYSLALYLQQAARGMRKDGDKIPVILDHGRLLERFGLPEADRDYQLTSTTCNPSVIHQPTKVCERCGKVAAVGDTECSGCGAPLPVVVFNPIPAEVPAILIPYDATERARVEARLWKHAKTKGYPDEWVQKLIDIWVGFHDRTRHVA